MSDLIDRQAAIDRIEEHLRCGDELYPLTETDKILNHAFEIAASCVYNLPSAQPDLDEWCTDCKEYDHEQHCCPRWNRVIRNALKDAQPEPRWIPVEERLPKTDEMMLVTCQPKKGLPNVNRAYYMNGSWHGSGSMSGVTAWMPLPKPYERG